MKLSEIVAELKALKETVTSWMSDKAKATTDALTAFSAKLGALEAGAVAELTAAQTRIAELTGQLADAVAASAAIPADLAGVTAALDAALASAKVTPKAGATPQDKITALTGAVTEAIAKAGVAAEHIPASTGVRPRTVSEIVKQYDAITDPTARTLFYRANKAAIDASFRQPTA